MQLVSEREVGKRNQRWIVPDIARGFTGTRACHREAGQATGPPTDSHHLLELQGHFRLFWARTNRKFLKRSPAAKGEVGYSNK